MQEKEVQKKTFLQKLSLKLQNCLAINLYTILDNHQYVFTMIFVLAFEQLQISGLYFFPNTDKVLETEIKFLSYEFFQTAFHYLFNPQFFFFKQIMLTSFMECIFVQAVCVFLIALATIYPLLARYIPNRESLSNFSICMKNLHLCFNQVLLIPALSISIVPLYYLREISGDSDKQLGILILSVLLIAQVLFFSYYTEYICKFSLQLPEKSTVNLNLSIKSFFTIFLKQLIVATYSVNHGQSASSQGYKVCQIVILIAVLLYHLLKLQQIFFELPCMQGMAVKAKLFSTVLSATSIVLQILQQEGSLFGESEQLIFLLVAAPLLTQLTNLFYDRHISRILYECDPRQKSQAKKPSLSQVRYRLMFFLQFYDRSSLHSNQKIFLMLLVTTKLSLEHAEEARASSEKQRGAPPGERQHKEEPRLDREMFSYQRNNNVSTSQLQVDYRTYQIYLQQEASRFYNVVKDMRSE